MFLRWRGSVLFAIVTVAVLFWLPQLVWTIGAEDAVKQISHASTTPPSEAEKVKAQAEMVKAQAEAQKAENDFLRAEAEKVKAQAEAKKADVDYIKADDARKQFYWDFAYRALLSLAAVVILIWYLPQFQEFVLSLGSASLTAKRAPKESVPSAPPNLPRLTPLGAQAIETVKKRLMEASDVPGPAAERIVDNLEETEEYREAGLVKDSIYACHRARKVPRSDYYQVQIYLDADEPSILDKVEKVTYQLHQTFPERERTLTNRGDRFQLEIKAWGEFMLYALVYFKGRSKPVRLRRYLNF